MTKVYIIRHAEAEGNLYRRAQGQYDSQVTPRGKRQIEALARRFEGIEVDAVYSSDLTRTRETAAAVCEPKGLPLILDKRLREVKMGAWEDMPWGEIEWREQDELIKFNLDPINWHIDGSEDFFELRRRLTAAIDEIAASNEGRTVAVVSHGCAIRAYLSGLVNGENGGIENVPHGDNTNVSLVEYRGGERRLAFFGDASHLPADESTFAHQKWWKEQTTLDSSNLRFEPFEPGTDIGLYETYRREAYKSVHGTMEGFPADCTRTALRHAAGHPRAITLAYAGGLPAGCLELAVNRDKSSGAGCVMFFYMTPDFRGSGMGVQLLGEATSVYRELGRERLRVFISEDNVHAMEFFESNLFARAGETEGRLGKVYIMERGIALLPREG